MDGPYYLSEKDIHHHLKEASCGVYLLSRGNKAVHYVGRSETNLRSSLKQHLRKGIYSQFWFELTKSALDAYYLECRLYHDYMPEDNQNKHPTAAPDSTWKCPVAGCSWNT